MLRVFALFCVAVSAEVLITTLQPGSRLRPGERLCDEKNQHECLSVHYSEEEKTCEVRYGSKVMRYVKVDSSNCFFAIENHDNGHVRNIVGDVYQSPWIQTGNRYCSAKFEYVNQDSYFGRSDGHYIVYYYLGKSAIQSIKL